MGKERKNELSVVGFIGVGPMGSKMVLWLLQADYRVVVYDIDSNRLEEIAREGAVPVASAQEVVREAEIVMTSLPFSETWVDVAEKYLVPNARKRQIFIDVGTVVPGETRRLASAFKERGAFLIDAPVSNGNAPTGKLYMFIAGEKEIVEKCWHIFEVLGDPRHTVYCGPSGNGQIVKGVNQLSVGLVNAAIMEAIGFGVRAGVKPEAIVKAIGEEKGWRSFAKSVGRAVIEGRVEHNAIKHGQLMHYLTEAHAKGFELPISNALYGFCKGAPNRIRDANRESPSFWHELMTRTVEKR